MKIENKGDTIVITIDVSDAAKAKATPSASGKTMVLASTRGFARYGDVNVSLNATIPAKA